MENNMTTLQIALHFDEKRKAEVLKQLQALDLGENGRIEWSTANAGLENLPAGLSEADVADWHDAMDQLNNKLEEPGLSWEDKLKILQGDA